jgi:hypothetical protein
MCYHVYLVTDARGCSPLLSTRPLPWQTLRELADGFLILPRGSYVRVDRALEECAEIEAVNDELSTEQCSAAATVAVLARQRRVRS